MGFAAFSKNHITGHLCSMLRLHCIIHKGKNLLCKGETIMGLIEQSMIPLNKAIKAMKLDPGAAAIIAVPEKTTEVHIPVKMDNGKVQVLRAIVASTAPSWDRPRAACGIIRLSIWMK
jgi:hypothetical protein